MENIIRDRKYVLLWAGLAIFLLICYQLAFKPTIEAWNHHTELKESQADAGMASAEPLYQVRKKRNLDTLISKFKIDTGLFHTEVINKIALIAQKQQVKLTDIPQPDQLSSAGAYLVQKLVLEGNYFSLLRTLNDLRSAGQVGFIRSVTVKMPDRDRLVKQQVLAMIVYMEIIRSNK